MLSCPLPSCLFPLLTLHPLYCQDYEIVPGKLIINSSVLVDSPTITTTVELVPEEKTQLSGLYKSSPMYCFQCGT